MKSFKRTMWIFFPLLLLSLGALVSAQNEVVVTVDLSKEYQTMKGFGAAIAWYDNWVTAHPNREGIYDAIFTDLGLDILRIQNWYGKSEPLGVDISSIVRAGRERLGDSFEILMTSWVPTVELKSNGSLGDGGTLKKVDGQYAYDLFADYWYDSLQAYAEIGIIPDYISIQNEPDYPAEWNAMLLAATETPLIAGYSQALDAVYDRLQEMDSPPKILGPEVIGLGYNTIQDFLKNMDLTKIDGIAYHLYHGGDHTKPDSFKFNMLNVASNYPDIPIFQTEFNRGTGFENAWLIHNSLTSGNVSAYLFWDLIWDQAGLVTVEFPWDRTRWQTEEGYFKTEHYYAVQHYSKYISQGYQRVGTSTSRNDLLKTTAFIAPDQSQITVVILNTSLKDELFRLELENYTIVDSSVYITEFGVKDGAAFADYGSLSDSGLNLPKQSAATIVLHID